MNQQLTLKITSLVSILLFSLHWADEVARGIEPGNVSAVGGLLILGLWSYAALVISERRWGLVILLLGAILASGVPILHMQGKGLIGGRIAAGSDGALFWVWTLVALAPSGMLSVVLSARSLWIMRRKQTS